MKTTFSINRLLRLFRNDWALNYKKYGLLALCVIGLTAMTYIGSAFAKASIELYAVWVLGLIAMFFFQGIYTATVWSEFTSKKRTISLLTLPVNKSEIFTQKFISCFVIFPILYVLYLLLTMKLTTIHNSFLDIELENKYTSISFVLSDVFSSYKLIYLLGWLPIASIFFWGAIHFKKYAFLKTLASWLTGLFLLWPIAIVLRLIITGEYNNEIFPLVAYVENSEAFFIIQAYPHFYYYLSAFVSLSLLCISYLKFKEKTI